MRTYIVLRSDPDGENLQLVELCEANGSHQAIKRTRQAAADALAADLARRKVEAPVDADREQEWHAVPLRNWTTLSVQTVVVAPTTTYTEKPLLGLPLRAADPAEDDGDERGGDPLPPQDDKAAPADPADLSDTIPSMVGATDE